ncbi:unnamed protein product [Camellia sinensis]
MGQLELPSLGDSIYFEEEGKVPGKHLALYCSSSNADQVASKYLEHLDVNMAWPQIVGFAAKIHGCEMVCHDLREVLVIVKGGIVVKFDTMEFKSGYCVRGYRVWVAFEWRDCLRPYTTWKIYMDKHFVKVGIGVAASLLRLHFLDRVVSWL